MILVSRSKKKIIGLEGYGITIKKQEITKMKKILNRYHLTYYKDISDNLKKNQQ